MVSPVGTIGFGGWGTGGAAAAGPGGSPADAGAAGFGAGAACGGFESSAGLIQTLEKPNAGTEAGGDDARGA